MSMNVSSSPSGSSVLRKGMRKGTHSCFECRRRKIRCLFRPDDSAICVPCKSRGSQCTEQRRELLQDVAEKNKASLRERVAKLEAIIDAAGLNGHEENTGVLPQIAQRRESSLGSLVFTEHAKTVPIATVSSPDKSTTHSASYQTQATSVDADSPQDIDPIINLFNNAIWQRRTPDGNNGSDVHGESVPGMSTDSAEPQNLAKILAKRIATREMLLSVLPAPELLGAVLNVTNSWWNTWKSLGPWVSDAPDEKPKTLQEFILWAFKSENPSIVGLGVLCVAVSIQLLDSRKHEYLIRRLQRLPGELYQEYFEQVDRLIVNDSEYACSREGIEVMTMLGKIMMNLGLIKKCWVLNHRASSYAQILGLHRPQRLSARETDAQRAFRHRAWLSICQADSLLSLLLGLPYASDGRTVPVINLGEVGTAEYFKNKILGPSARVIDRNQMGLNLSVPIAEEIQMELDALVTQMYPDFWDPSLALANGSITRGEYFEHITAHFKYNLLRVFIHMPLMIQSVEDPTLEAHRDACLDASRDALKIYHIMHSDITSAFSMIKLIDYQAFICSSLLLLGLMGYGRAHLKIRAIASGQDLELLQLTLDMFREASMSNNTVASQAVQGLETLMNLASGKSCPPAGQRDDNPYARIVVPYTGTITISPGTFFTSQQTAAQVSTDTLPHVFTLSHDSSHLVQGQLPSHDPNQEVSFQSGQESQGMTSLEYPSIEFDWSGMMNVNSEEDWSWLMDVNANGMNGNIWNT